LRSGQYGLLSQECLPFYLFDKRTKQEHYPIQQIKERVMYLNQMIKSGFECAAFAGALGMMVFWADIVSGFTG